MTTYCVECGKRAIYPTPRSGKFASDREHELCLRCFRDFMNHLQQTAPAGFRRRKTSKGTGTLNFTSEREKAREKSRRNRQRKKAPPDS
ncbi:MAG: hypothetical protein V1848_03700 [Candidatus Magasanikbacteria bacterium]